MCGAVFASRLANFVLENSRYKFSKIYHFLDSMTVLGAINKDSYGFSTFYANRIGEIRSNTEPENWLWIPPAQNPSDSITRGASPIDLNQDSLWQKGPEWLYLPESEWPISREINDKSQSDVHDLQRKAFSKVTTRLQAKQGARDNVLVGGRPNNLTEKNVADLGECFRISNFSQVRGQPFNIQGEGRDIFEINN